MDAREGDAEALPVADGSFDTPWRCSGQCARRIQTGLPASDCG
jgi:hypothetical protein